MQVREKVAKSRFTVFFQWVVAPEDRKIGSLKRRVQSNLARWEMKNYTPGAKHIWKSKVLKTDRFGALLKVEMLKKCTPLWREAHFELKVYKTPQPRSTFGSRDIEKMRTVVARSTCRSQNIQNHFPTKFGSWDVEKVHAVVAPSTFRKRVKDWRFRSTFWSWDVENARVVARSTFGGENAKDTTCSDHFWTFNRATI